MEFLVRRSKNGKKAYLEFGIEGLKSQTGKAKHPGKGNHLSGLHLKKNKTREEELELENLKLKVEVARLKKGYQVKGVGSKKGIRYYQRLEYEVLDELSKQYPISLLCNVMDVNRSGYYKWKYRKLHPSARHTQRIKDVEFIKEESNKHKAHGYRWLAAFLKRKYGVIMSAEYVYRCRKYAGVICESKHYRYKKPGESSYIYPNLIRNNWNASKPLEIIVSDMTSFYSRGIYYELTLYFDTFNREIVGFGLTDRRGDAKPYFEGLEQVIGLIKEKEQTNLSTLHTDQGSVYSSEVLNKLLTNNNIIHSMSRAGTPTDNPIDESLKRLD